MEPYVYPDHPDAAQEAAHLRDTCAVIAAEKRSLEAQTRIGAEEERDFSIRSDGTFDDQTAINLFLAKMDALRRLAMAERQAYFARVDFVPASGTPETHYIGRWGVVRTEDLEVVVCDWRSPVANLYYAGQLGLVDYEAPDGEVHGELTLKRLLGVEGDRLLSVFDTGVASQDAYLQSVLGAVSSDRLKDIVTTIQREQNVVIRYPLREDLIVQGAAGSGKTTIALHRIAYLLYTYRDQLRPENMMILAPSPLFLSYISQVLPDLGVERVRQTTFAALCASWMGKHMPRLRQEGGIEERLTMPDHEAERMIAVRRRKGSLDFLASLETFLAGLDERILPPEGLVFANRPLMTAEQLRTVFLRQLKPWPIATRVTELRKYVQRRLDKLCDALRETLRDMAAQRLEQIMAAMPDSPERRARIGRLLDSRDARLRDIDEHAKQYMKDLPGLFPALSPLSVYREYLTACEDATVAAATLPVIEKKQACPEDLPALCVIARALYGLPRETVRHIVIDECQDFSPAHLVLLRAVYPGATFTLVGDLMQGVHDDTGIRAWEEWLGPVFDQNASLRTLAVSYRSTVEIMEAASRVGWKWPVSGEIQVKPVLRHGETPRMTAFASEKEHLAAIAEQVKAWQAEGFASIALIANTLAQAKRLHKRLSALMDVRLMTDGDAEYAGGVIILPAASVKGFEFDCVLLCDVGEASFPNDAFHTRLLYVMMTRPLHRLCMFAVGPLTELLT